MMATANKEVMTPDKRHDKNHRKPVLENRD